MSQIFDKATAYAEKLKDPRWIEFRNNIRELRGNYCQWCGMKYLRGYGNLHVHHMGYAPNAEPWEYDISDVVLICDKCHDACHIYAIEVKAKLNNLPEATAICVVSVMQMRDAMTLYESINDSLVSSILMIVACDRVGKFPRPWDKVSDCAKTFQQDRWKSISDKLILRFGGRELERISRSLDEIAQLSESVLARGAEAFWKSVYYKENS